MKAIDAISRFILGAVFLFSGYVKAVDPWGMAYKIGDYLTAYDLQFLQPLAATAAVSIIAVEVLLGFFFLFNLYPKASIYGMLLVESFFTILTFLSWYTNAVSDCGCFGDAIKLTNAETFWKNVILMVFVLWLFLRRNLLQAWFNRALQLLLGVVFIGLTFGFQYYNYAHLPIHDFRPYHLGVDIKKQMELPEGAKPDIFETKLIYTKDGVDKEFTDQNYPWQDTTWVWKDTKTVLLQKGDVPPIHDLSILNADGDDWLPMLLDDPGYKFLLIAYQLPKTNVAAFKAAEQIKNWCAESKVGFYPVTASSADDQAKLLDASGTNFSFFAADATTLKTIIRANPGLVLIKGSTIVGKWHYNDFPQVEQLSELTK